MKKFISIFFSTLMFFAFISIPYASAHTEAIENSLSEVIVSETTEYFKDGSSITTIITKQITPTPFGSTYTTSGSKAYIARNKDLEELWRFTVHGTFSVNSGVSSTCTAASYSISISNDAWENESASAYRSGNQAIGDATFIRKLLLITVERRSCHVVLTCDKNGNLS